MKIKVCGLSREKDIEMANHFLPDYIGFVFYEKSKRNVSYDTALRLKKMLDKKINSVGVFVDADIDFIATLCRDGIIDMIQLHGSEDDKYISKLRRLTSVPIIKAVRVKNSDDILRAQSLNVDYLLLDAYVSGEAGGSGITFDHKLIPKIKKPFFLAGGLNENNLEKACSICTPYAVDVSSGVEKNGVKNFEKFGQLVNLARSL